MRVRILFCVQESSKRRHTSCPLKIVPKSVAAFLRGEMIVTSIVSAEKRVSSIFVHGLIGAANATAVAGGFELLMACDLIVASDEARFGLPEVKRALFPAGGGVFMSRRIPLAVALELTLTGDYIDAPRALDLGLVNLKQM